MAFFFFEAGAVAIKAVSGAVILDQPRRQTRTVDEGYGSGVKRQVGR